MYWQLYDEVKRLILEGIIPPGSSLPSPRLVAAEFGCSRHTVATAYDFLIAEGFLSASHGVGTFVSPLPDLLFGAGRASTQAAGEGHPLMASRFAADLMEGGMDRDEEDPLQTFGIPDVGSFPYELWSKTHSRVWSRPKRALLQSTSALGYEGLRQAICGFVHRTRGIRASPDQVLVTSGTTQSLDLLLRALLNPGDIVWIEDPGRPKAATLITASGLQSAPIPVDEHGLRVDIGEERAPSARAVLITPSHHYPTGATLSLDRRFRLLAWAERTGGWVFEDDYDGEIVADGRPILPVYSLGQHDRVVYMGTFSKSISPQLRIGYIICRPDLIRLLVKLRYYTDYFPPISMQPVLAEFLDGGHLETHIRKMRRLYRERQSLFVEQIMAHGVDEFVAFPNAPTLFQTLGLRGSPPALLDRTLAFQMRASGVPAFPLSSFYFLEAAQPGVIIGTGRLDLRAIPPVVKRLVEAYRELRTTP